MTDPKQRLETRLRNVRRDYANQLPKKIEKFNTCWRTLQKNPTQNTLDELRRLLHHFAGSGRTFGFAYLSAAARNLEQALQGLETKTVNDQWCSDHLNLFEELTRSASLPQDQITIPVAKPVAGNAHGTRSRRSVLIVEDSEHELQELTQQLTHHGYRIHALASTSGLIKSVEECRPDVILLDIVLEEGETAGLEAVSKLNSKLHRVPPLVFISERDDFAVRLQAHRLGGAAFFTKPLNLVGLTETLESLTMPRVTAPYRILIFDDDADFSYYTALQLQRGGLDTQVETQPARLLHRMAEFRPDLVLLDLYMPQCSGIEIAAIIRQQESYLGVPIVFFSVETDIQRHLAMIRAGSDDFLHKSIDPAQLITTLEARCKRARLINTALKRDGLTGLLNHSCFMEYLRHDLARVQRQNGELTLVVLDLDHFKKINDEYGHPAGDHVLKVFAHFLRSRLRSSDIAGRIGGEEFALLLRDTGVTQARHVIDEMRNKFAKLDHYWTNKAFRITVSAGIASFADNDQGPGLYQAADQALYRAKQGGRNRVEIA
jgi:diguanylate cyclase (GGDEF)-like protein